MNRTPKSTTGRLLYFWVGSALVLFLLLVVGLLAGDLTYFDSWVYGHLSGLINPRLTDVVILITHLGGERFLITASVLVFLLLLWRQGWLTASLAAANLPFSSLVNTLLKYCFLRARPEVLRLVEIGGYSFPSGHSFVSMSFYGLLIVLALRLLPPGRRLWVCLPLGLLIALIGLSRIYLGVHYASDVLAGMCGGFIWLAVYRYGAKRLWPHLPL